MKRIKTILTCAVVLAVTGFTSLVIAAAGQTAGKATVKSIKGIANYRDMEGGEWKKLRVNQELMQGAEIKTDAGAEVYMTVNGITSVVKIGEKTDLKVDKMLKGGGDSSTDIKLDGGNVLGQVKKLSANSDYTVTVPNGVAGIRGTDFSVTVTVDVTTGNLTVTFTSVTGTVFCQVVAPGAPSGSLVSNGPSQTLQTGQSWTVTGTTSGTTATVGIPATTPTAVQQAALTIIAQQFPTLTIVVTTPPSTPPPYVPPTNPGTSGGGTPTP